MNKEDQKELKQPEIIKKAKIETIELCPNCGLNKIYEVFANKLYRCMACNINIKPQSNEKNNLNISSSFNIL